MHARIAKSFRGWRPFCGPPLYMQEYRPPLRVKRGGLSRLPYSILKPVMAPSLASRLASLAAPVFTGFLVGCVLATPVGAQTRERRAVTAHPVATPLTIDGSLEEAFYRTVQPASDFIQI